MAKDQDSGGGHRDRVSESREIIKALVLDSGPIAGTAGPADFEPTPSAQSTDGSPPPSPSTSGGDAGDRGDSAS